MTKPTKPPTSRAGWRFFYCQECDKSWKETCRDRFTHSVEYCECGEPCQPFDSSEYTAVAVDNAGNVIKHERIVD